MRSGKISKSVIDGTQQKLAHLEEKLGSLQRIEEKLQRMEEKLGSLQRMEEKLSTQKV